MKNSRIFALSAALLLCLLNANASAQSASSLSERVIEVSMTPAPGRMAFAPARFRVPIDKESSPESLEGPRGARDLSERKAETGFASQGVEVWTTPLTIGATEARLRLDYAFSEVVGFERVSDGKGTDISFPRVLITKPRLPSIPVKLSLNGEPAIIAKEQSSSGFSITVRLLPSDAP